MSGTESLRIGIVSWDYEPPIGGMGRHVRTLVDGLRRQGHTVTVFSKSDFRLPFGRSILFSILLPFVLQGWIRRHDLDALHVHAGPGGVFLLRKPKRVSLLVIANHTYADQARCVGESWKRALVPFERRTYGFADAIVCISQDTCLSLIHEYRIPKSMLTVVPCGIDVSFFSSRDRTLSERGKRCVFVGRRDKRKGFDLLMRAWEIIASKNSDAVLHLVGVEGVSTERVFFEGRCSDDVVATRLGSSRVSIVPSRLEGFGLIAAEAIASGTPVIATDVPGLRSVVTNFETGLLVTLDPADLAENILTLLENDVLWERVHAGCVRRRDIFDATAEVEHVASLTLRYTRRQ